MYPKWIVEDGEDVLKMCGKCTFSQWLRVCKTPD